MRDVIYRAWNKVDRYMVESNRSICTIIQHRMNIPQHTGWNSYEEPSNRDDYILMQCTGLQTYDFESYEKVNIFEGDILRFDYDEYENGGFKEHVGIVYWSSGSFYVDCTEIEHDSESLYLLSDVCYGEHPAEIIGNIFENSELLEK